MKRACLGVALVMAMAGTSAAGTYVGLGIGTAPAFSEQGSQLGEMDSNSRSGRVVAGMRFGNVSVEGAVGGYDLSLKADSGGVDPFGSLYSASAALKLSLPLGNNFEAFGRVGVHHTWISADDSRFDVSGNGLLIGAGIEYRLNLLVGQGSIFMDYQYSKAKLDGEVLFDRNALDTSSRMFTIGLTVGL